MLAAVLQSGVCLIRVDDAQGADVVRRVLEMMKGDELVVAALRLHRHVLQHIRALSTSGMADEDKRSCIDTNHTRPPQRHHAVLQMRLYAPLAYRELIQALMLVVVHCVDLHARWVSVVVVHTGPLVVRLLLRMSVNVIEYKR